jgi:hypothetical protein
MCGSAANASVETAALQGGVIYQQSRPVIRTGQFPPTQGGVVVLQQKDSSGPEWASDWNEEREPSDGDAHDSCPEGSEFEGT